MISRYHSLSLVVTLCHSFLRVVTRCTTCCHSLSLIVSFVVTRCHSIYQSSVFLQPIKLRSVINEISKSFLKFTVNGKNKSIDTSMIFNFTNHGSRQRVNNKPGPMGCNIWGLAEAYGYLVQFKPYQGVKKGK